MSESEQGAGEGRRRFDDVASLFGSIVPAPGSAVRTPLRPFRPLPTGLPAPAMRPGAEPAVEPTGAPPSAPEAEAELGAVEPVVAAVEPVVVPAAVPSVVEAAAVPAAASERAEPALPVRPRPTQIPWPDAFEPQPNYRRPEPRNWSWLLLIPAGVAVAAAISMLDPRWVRNWVDANLLHRSAPAGSSAALPPAFRSGTTPEAAGASSGGDVIPFPPLPTSPVPVPPGTAVSPPPVDPAQAAAAAAAPLHVTMQFRRGIPGAEGEARRLAALLQNYGGSVELQPAEAVDTPTITYHSPADRELAGRVASYLAREANGWTLRLGEGGAPAGTIDVALP